MVHVHIITAVECCMRWWKAQKKKIVRFGDFRYDVADLWLHTAKNIHKVIRQ